MKRTDRNQTFLAGELIAEEVVEVDITAEVVELDLHDRARTAFLANKAFLASNPSNAEALAQVDALTRQMNALIKLVLADFAED